MQGNSSPITPAERRRFLKLAAAATAAAGVGSLSKAWAAPSRRRYGPIGLSLHLGLNQLDSGFYGDAPTLRACYRDASDMSKIAYDADFHDSRVLFDDEASYPEVRRYIRSAGEMLEDGDLFVLTLAGHGAQVRDDSSGEDDEAWCLYDRFLLKDELYSWLRDFQPGVRVLAIMDSGHVGSAEKAKQLVNDVKSGAVELPNLDPKFKAVSQDLIRSHITQARGFRPPPLRGLPLGDNYTLIRALPARLAEKIAYREGQRIASETKRSSHARSRSNWPGGFIIRACEHQEFAFDGFGPDQEDKKQDANGLFTWAFKKALEKHPKDYRGLVNAISATLREEKAPQQPSLYTFGDEEYTEQFKREKPFQIF